MFQLIKINAFWLTFLLVIVQISPRFKSSVISSKLLLTRGVVILDAKTVSPSSVMMHLVETPETQRSLEVPVPDVFLNVR